MIWRRLWPPTAGVKLPSGQIIHADGMVVELRRLRLHFQVGPDSGCPTLISPRYNQRVSINKSEPRVSA
jgi:hypothetical protein